MNSMVVVSSCMIYQLDYFTLFVMDAGLGPINWAPNDL
jgi:hypothetical protein